MDWFEGVSDVDFDAAHEALDDGGAWVRETFGCQLTFENGTYYQECPVALAHNRSGLSVGMIINQAQCSICGRDPEDCEHITGRLYGDDRCIRIIKDAEVREVSLVARPAQPDARISKVSIDREDLQEQLGPRWHPGIPVNCDRCLTACEGVADPFLGH
jgi:hypothetical protein